MIIIKKQKTINLKIKINKKIINKTNYLSLKN